MSDQLALDLGRRTPRPVRSSDPVTSRAAARSINLKARKAEVLDALWHIGLCNSSARATASEVHRTARRRGSKQEPGSVRSRLAQLATDGLVYRTGGVSTVPTEHGGTGRPEQVWDFTRAGLEYMANRGAA